MSMFHSMLYSQRSFVGILTRQNSKSPAVSRDVSTTSLIPMNIIQPGSSGDVSADSEFFRFLPQHLLVHIDDILRELPFGRM